MQRSFQRFMVPLYTQDTATRIRQTVQKVDDKLLPQNKNRLCSRLKNRTLKKRRDENQFPTIEYFERVRTSGSSVASSW